MADTVNEVTLTSPSGKTPHAHARAERARRLATTIEANELGLWRATDGTLNALVNVGPANPREFTEVTSTTECSAPLADATGGDVVRVEDGGGVHVPRILAVRSSDTFKGDDWLGLEHPRSERGARHRRAAVFAGLIGLLLLIGSLAVTWMREGR